MDNKLSFFLTSFSYLFYTVSLFYTWSLCLNTTDEYKSTTLTLAIIGSAIVITYGVTKFINSIDETLHFDNADIVGSINVLLWDIITLVMISGMEFKDEILIRLQLLTVWGNIITMVLLIFNIIIYIRMTHKSINPGPSSPVDINRKLSSESDDNNETSSLIGTKNNSTQ